MATLDLRSTSIKCFTEALRWRHHSYRRMLWLVRGLTLWFASGGEDDPELSGHRTLYKLSREIGYRDEAIRRAAGLL